MSVGIEPIPTLASAARLQAIELGGANVLLQLEESWDALVDRSPEPTPFLRARWLHAWWQAFGRGTPRLVAVYDLAGQLVGGALFQEYRGRFDGVPARILALAANVHSNRADLIVDAECAIAAAEALAAWAASRSWTVLRMEEAPVDSDVRRAFIHALGRSHHLGVRSAARPPWIALDGGLAAFDATLKSKWKSNLRNRVKRFAALGENVHETIRERVPDLSRRLDECFALEATAWKGSSGSAIISQESTLRFYQDIARDAAADGSLRLQCLRVSGRLAAFQLDLEDAGVEYVLKIGYEPQLAAFSPGALLLRRVIEQAAAAGLHRIDLLGDDMPWKRDWTANHREHCRSLVFGRGPAGRALHALEFKALPMARRIRDRLEKKGPS